MGGFCLVVLLRQAGSATHGATPSCLYNNGSCNNEQMCV